MEEYFAKSAGVPVIDLEALLHDYQLGLVLIAGTGRDTSTRPVQWVHSSDLQDPTPFLTPRTVLLTTGAQFAHESSTETFELYVHRLVDARATALGIGVGLQWERIPPPLIDACDRLHLPLFRVPYDTPFLAVVRTAARLLEARAVEDWGREDSVPARLGRVAAGEAALRSAVLQLLLEGRRDLAERIAVTALPPLPRGALAVLSFADPSSGPFANEIAPLITEQPGVLSASTSGQTTVVLESGLLAGLRRLLARHSIAAGVSERGSVGELSELVEQAARAAELARQQDPPAPVDYRPAMHAGVMQLLQESPEAARRAHGLLAPLHQHDERHGDRLTASLSCWLRHNGQLTPAAAELGVHRHTLRSRVQTAEALLQRDLGDPDVRAELWTALRLAAD